MRKFFSTLLLLVSITSCAYGTTYHVATDGSGDFTTIAQVNAFSFTSGDSVKFNGIFRGQLLVPSSGVTITSYGSGATFLGSIDGDSVGLWTDEGSNIWSMGGFTGSHIANIFYNTNTSILVAEKKATLVACTTQWDWFFNSTTDKVYVYSTANPATLADGLEITDSTQQGSDGNIEVYNGINNVTIDGVTVKYFNCHGIMIWKDCNNCIVKNNTVTYGGGTSRVMDSSSAGNGIDFQNGDTILIDNNTISYIYDDAIGIESVQNTDVTSNATITNNIISYCGLGGIALAISGSGTNTFIQDCLIDSNTITNIGNGGSWQRNPANPKDYSGLRVIGLDTVNTNQFTGNIFSNNSIYDCASSGLNCKLGGATFQNNTIYNNDAYGFYIGGNSQGTLDSNEFYGNTLDCIWFDNMDDTTGWVVKNNLIHDNTAKGFYELNGSGKFTIYNNTFYDNGGVEFYITPNGAASNYIVKNNIFYSTSQILSISNTATTSTLEFNNNCYYRAAGTMIFWKGTNYTLAQFTTYQSDTSQDTNSITSDPLFRSATDYRLQSSSPCIDSGINLDEVTDDYEGTPRPIGGTTDIGAYEFYSKKIRNATLKDCTI